MLKAVIFDLDNTLYDYDAAHAPAFAAVSEYALNQFGIPAGRFEALHARAQQALIERCGVNCAASHNRLIRYQVLLEEQRLPLWHAPVMAHVYWSTLMDAMRANPGATAALKALRDRGLAIGIGTNMTADWQYEKLRRLGMLEYVDFIVTSEEVTAEKPDRKLFDCCAQKAGCAAGECAFVGDNLQADVLGAIAAGMRGIWLRRPDQPDREIPGGASLLSLEAMPELIEMM